MTTVSTRAVLGFADAQGMPARFSIPRARLDKTAQQAIATMNAMIETGALALSGIGPVTEIHSAKIVHTTRTQIA